MTKTILVPELLTFIDKKANATGKSIDNTTFVDMGHWHNRGRVLECLADHFREQAAFVRIRRDRYSIANSFAKEVQTPCMHGGLPHSIVSVCPRLGEDAGPVNLPVPSDQIWDAMTPFQKFLWYADEMEHRWYTLTTTYDIDSTTTTTTTTTSIIATSSEQESEERGRPAFHEMTWNNADELSQQINELRIGLGCNQASVQNKKQHVAHKTRALNCSDFIQQDLQYRRMMNYDNATLQILVSSRFPQHLDSGECMETRQELKEAIEKYAASEGLQCDENAWVLPIENHGDVGSLLKQN